MEIVSVIVPVYNVEEYLPRCIDSILAQTYKKLEVILIDDGSVDKSGEICDFYANNNSNIKVVHKENGGVSSARNAGMDISNGEYLCFVDADDAITTDCIEMLYEMISGGSCDVSVCGVRYVSSIDLVPTAAISASNSDSIARMTGVQSIKAMLYQKAIDNGPVAKLYRRSLIGSDRFNQDIAIAEDLDMNFRLFLKADSVIVCSAKSYLYWQRPGSAMRSSFSKKRLDGLTVLKNLLETAGKNRPELINSIKNRLFIEAVLVASEISFNNQYYSKEFKECLSLVKSLRLDLVKDGNSRARFRLYALISMFSSNLLIKLFIVKRARRKHGQ